MFRPALAAALLLTAPLLAEDAKPPAFHVYPVETDLHRELLYDPKINVVAVLDSTDVLAGGKFAFDRLDRRALTKALEPHKKADARLHFFLFFPRPTNAHAEHQRALPYALIGLGHREAGFDRVTAHSYYPNTDATWKEWSAAFTGKARQPKGPETAVANALVKAYPVRTPLSRYLTFDADCALVVTPPLKDDKGVLTAQIRDVVAKLKLKHSKRVAFYVDDKAGDMKTLLEELQQLGRDLKFETSSVTFR